MKVGLLIITHSDIGQSLYNTAIAIIGSATLNTEIMTASMDCDPEEILKQARKLLKKLNGNNGVMVLTDMYGATPSNIATELLNQKTVLVSGLNLPMLLRVMNYPDLSLNKLVEKAITGGREGVLALTAQDQ